MQLEGLVDRSIVERISALREVDSVIDLARGWLQLSILLVVGSKGRTSVDELVRLLGQPRKTILDSLRKMKAKRLIHEDSGLYSLTRDGTRVYRLLLSAINSARFGNAEAGNVGLRRGAAGFQEEFSVLVRSLYLYEALIALASNPRRELPLKVIAQLTMVSPTKLDKYLSVYVEKGIFERYVREEGMLIKRRRVVYYRLTEEGEKLARRLPEYLHARKSLPARILVSLTNALHPRIVLKRLTYILSFGSSAAMVAAVLLPDYAVLLLAGWVVFVSFLALLISQSY